MTARAARGRAAATADRSAVVDAARRRPDAAEALAALLAEDAPLYTGLGTGEAERVRGYVLAGLESAGLPSRAVPFVLEELELGRAPATVTAAARALRGAAEVPAEAPALLVAAIDRLRLADDVVSLERLEPTRAQAGAVTLLAELARTLAFLGPRARPALASLRALLEREGETFSPAVRAELEHAVREVARSERSGSGCCAPPCESDTPEARREQPVDLAGLELESQDGTRMSFSEAFSGRPTALAFFYTRCATPEKCSLTVTRLGRLARLVANGGLDANVAGITYDPGFDRRARLATYGVDRGMVFSPRCSLFRTVGPFSPLREAFALGVGFGPVTVNRHRLDLVVLDASLRVTKRFERRLWHEEDVLEALGVGVFDEPGGARLVSLSVPNGSLTRPRDAGKGARSK
jgi:protein SCO1/2